jgi:hypothetical protein
MKGTIAFSRSICNHVGLDSAFLVAGLVVIKINYYWGESHSYQCNSLSHTPFLFLIHGHEVLRTPVRHCELNPIELIWAQVKGFVAENNTTFRLKDVKELVYGGFGRITKEVWAKAEDHVLKIEKEYGKENS